MAASLHAWQVVLVWSLDSKTHVADRRTSLRFEIVGRLRGSLATSQPVRLCDLSPGGALVELPFPPAVDSRHSVHVGVDAHMSTLDVRVRHVRPAFDVGRYLVGLEFNAPEHIVHEALGRAFADSERV